MKFVTLKIANSNIEKSMDHNIPCEKCFNAFSINITERIFALKEGIFNIQIRHYHKVS